MCAGHERSEGPCKHTTHNCRHGASAETKRLTNAQTGATNAHTGARNAQQCKARVRAHRGHAVEAPGNGTWPGAPPFSAPLAADRVCSCHRRKTTPVKSGRGWPARPHPNEQPKVLRQCYVALREASAHVSAGHASALGHSWRRPFLLRILGVEGFMVVCVLLCFIKPMLGIRYVRSRGFVVSEPRETHPRSEITNVLTSPCPPFENLGCPDPHPPP